MVVSARLSDLIQGGVIQGDLIGITSDPNAGVLSPKYEVFCCDQNGPPQGVRREHI
jgi:hypothetical protein